MKCTTILLTLAAGGILLAQPPAGPQPTFSELKTYLGLSDAALASITSAIQTSRTNTATLRQQLADKTKAIDTLVSSGSTDATAIGKAVLDAQTVRKQLETQNDALRSTVTGFLTADQKTKLASLQQAMALRPDIDQAMQLHLLTPPAGSGPGGPGPRGMMRGGPGGIGPMGFRPGGPRGMGRPGPGGPGMAPMGRPGPGPGGPEGLEDEDAPPPPPDQMKGRF